MIGSSLPERCSARIVSSDFAVGAKRAERVADRGRPVQPGDDTTLVGTVRALAERSLDHVRDAVRLASDRVDIEMSPDRHRPP